jgi:hypothetical protein
MHTLQALQLLTKVSINSTMRSRPATTPYLHAPHTSHASRERTTHLPVARVQGRCRACHCCLQAVAVEKQSREAGLEARHRGVLAALPPALALPQLFLDFVDSAANVAWVPAHRVTPKLRLLRLRSAADCWLGEHELGVLSGAAERLAVEAPRLGMAVAGLVGGGTQVRGAVSVSLLGYMERKSVPHPAPACLSSCVLGHPPCRLPACLYACLPTHPPAQASPLLNPAPGGSRTWLAVCLCCLEIPHVDACIRPGCRVAKLGCIRQAKRTL